MVRQFLDTVIFFSQHAVLTFALVYLVLRILDRLAGSAWVPGCLTGSAARRGLQVAVAVMLLTYVLISGWYLTLDGFAGEVEPIVSSLAWMVQDGHPLYHELNSPARYSVLYGPSVFLTNGLFLKVLGPSLASAKLASALAGAATLLLLFQIFRRPGHALDPLPLLAVGLSILYFWWQGFAMYLVRPDSLLVLAVCLALYCTLKAGRILTVVAVGVLLGFAVNLKFHGGLYFLPIMVLVARRLGLSGLWISLLVGVVTAFAPFALYDQISLANYLIWIGNAMEHGLTWQNFGLTARYTLGLLAPMLILWRLNPAPASWLAANRTLVGSYLLSVMAVLVLAAKPGAGMVHLLPLVPLSVYLTGVLARAVPLSTWTMLSLGAPYLRPARAGLLAVGAALILAGAVHEYRITRLVGWENQEGRALMGDIADIQQAYPQLTLGMAVGGEQACFRATWLRPLLVFNDHPLLLDPIAIMDCHLSGRELPPETYTALAQGQVAVWLVPRSQQPFAKVNWYPPHEPIFSRRFMEHFQANYTPRSHSDFFDLWVWNGLTEEALGKPAVASIRSLRPSS